MERCGKLEFPGLREDMILDMDAPVCWAGEATKGKGPYLLPYNYLNVATAPLSESVVGFYLEDYQFASIWTKYYSEEKKLVEAKVLGCVAPNFSAYFGAPKMERLWQVYRSRLISAKLQEAGIKILPDISGHPDDLDYMFEGIPIHKPVCLQLYRKLTEDEQGLKRQVIDLMWTHLAPSRVWIYGNPAKVELYPSLDDPRVEWIMPWGEVREQHRRLNKFDPRKKHRKSGKSE